MRFVTVLLLVLTLASQTGAEENERAMIVSGEGSVEAAPDMATISLGVREEARSAGDALSAMAKATRGIMGQLTAFGIDESDIQTSGLSLNPIYERQRNSTNAPPRIIGFAAANMVTVRTTDLDRLGTLLDAVVDAGANTFSGLRFGLKDRGELLEEARRKAVADALARAEIYADAAGVKLGEIISISEAGSPSVRQMNMRADAAFAESVPIAPGELTISARVSMRIGLD